MQCQKCVREKDKKRRVLPLWALVSSCVKALCPPAPTSCGPLPQETPLQKQVLPLAHEAD